MGSEAAGLGEAPRGSVLRALPAAATGCRLGEKGRRPGGLEFQDYALEVELMPLIISS